MPVKEADPEATSLDQAFAVAMGAAPKPKDPPAPKEIDPDAPHGRDDDGKPLTPFGLTKDGRPRRSAAGRPPREDQPRTGPASPISAGSGGQPDKETDLAAPGQYVKPLSDTADTIWFGLSALGKIAPSIPLIGKKLPAEKIQAQAAVWHATQDRMVAAVSLAAEHNAAAARFAAKLEGGDITWMITCLSLVGPVIALSGMVWAKDADVQLSQAEQPSVTELAAKNEQAMDMAIAQMTANAKLAAVVSEQAAQEQVAAVQAAAA